MVRNIRGCRCLECGAPCVAYSWDQDHGYRGEANYKTEVLCTGHGCGAKITVEAKTHALHRAAYESVHENPVEKASRELDAAAAKLRAEATALEAKATSMRMGAK